MTAVPIDPGPTATAGSDAPSAADQSAQSGARATAGPGVATTADAGTPGSARVAMWTVLLGILITIVGTSWDIQWHDDVGPDTFFTLPHLLLYSGSAVSGFASLALVLLTTAALRAGRPLPRAGGTPIRVLGRSRPPGDPASPRPGRLGSLTAPVGAMVSGAGAALFLLYGLFDLEWHSIYGFDAVLDSPSHVALFLSISITMTGSLMIFAAQRDQAWGRWGFVIALAAMIAFAPIAVDGLGNLAIPVNPIMLGSVFFSPLLLMTGAAVLGRSGAALIVAGALLVMQGVLWWFSPWAAETYAHAIGLPLRDGLVARPPAFPNLLPMFLTVGAVVVELGYGWARRGTGDIRRIRLIVGPLVGVVVAIGLPLQRMLTDSQVHVGASLFVQLVVLGLPLGLLAGYLARPIAVLLRALGPDESADDRSESILPDLTSPESRTPESAVAASTAQEENR
ncbi:hypothetical protein [Nocardia stercoris]|uniref:Uncharacterized protein n=1 Tax=Nocardia stercoris TaxID=2483361 RepID=A0A3M2L4M0_9NOCA|nr:hypothetical protein [Nocardia stercoris]RMI31916.1 hypothetical protein EBN03_17260 [Nocardia stercoris]